MLMLYCRPSVQITDLLQLSGDHPSLPPSAPPSPSPPIGSVIPLGHGPSERKELSSKPCYQMEIRVDSFKVIVIAAKCAKLLACVRVIPGVLAMKADGNEETAGGGGGEEEEEEEEEEDLYATQTYGGGRGGGVQDHNGLSQACYIVKIWHSGPEPSIYNFVLPIVIWHCNKDKKQRRRQTNIWTNE